jgi:hypothetical protein
MVGNIHWTTDLSWKLEQIEVVALSEQVSPCYLFMMMYSSIYYITLYTAVRRTMSSKLHEFKALKMCIQLGMRTLGSLLGISDGLGLPTFVGFSEGALVGSSLGDSLGDPLVTLGELVLGASDGLSESLWLGLLLGRPLGASDGPFLLFHQQKQQS